MYCLICKHVQVCGNFSCYSLIHPAFFYVWYRLSDQFVMISLFPAQIYSVERLIERVWPWNWSYLSPCEQFRTDFYLLALLFSPFGNARHSFLNITPLWKRNDMRERFFQMHGVWLAVLYLTSSLITLAPLFGEQTSLIYYCGLFLFVEIWFASHL